MDWYEFLLTVHIVAAGLWLGSGIAIWVVSQRLLAVDPAAFGPFARQAGWWAGKAHPAASVVIILAGFAMVADADIDMETWIVLALVGWVVLGAIGGAGISRTGRELEAAFDRGEPESVARLADRLLPWARIETGVLVLVIADMVAKPGLGG